MSRKNTKKNDMKPATAVLLLVACGGVAWFSLGKFFGSGPTTTGDATMVGDLEPEQEGSQEGEREDKVGQDLLAQHGSWTRAAPVRMAFASAADMSLLAAPAGETNAVAGARWVGADPPVLRVGVVMIGDTVRRAVVNGVVVGVGDALERAAIVGIQRDLVDVVWGGRHLTYDLENEYPREFRGELQRRAARDQASATESKQRQEGQ